MTTSRVNKIVKGNDETLIITLVDDNDQPYNLSGKSVVCEMRDKPGGSLIATASTTITDAANGVLEAKFNKTQTANITADVVYIDVKITDNATGEVVNAPVPPFQFIVVDPVTQ